MRLAVVGDNLTLAPFLRAVAARSGHEVAACVDAPKLSATLREVIHVPVLASWQELISDDAADVVLIADEGPETLEAARQLAAVNKPLLIWPNPGQGSTFVYQLTLIHAEQTLVLLPLLPLRLHPLVERLKSLLGEGLGRIQHLRIDATIRPTREQGFTPKQMGQRFLADVDLLRHLGGGYNQISASRSGTDEITLNLATATLTGESAPQALWSLAASPTESWKLTVAAEKGTVILTADGDPLEAALTAQGEPRLEREPSSEDDEADELWWVEALLDQCEELLQSPAKPRPTWSDLALAFELNEAFARSLEKRRMIEIHFDAPSERSVFKSQMAAVGCSVLIYTLVASTVFLLVSAAVPMPLMMKHVFRALVFLPVGVFLILQSLIFLTRASR